VLLDDPIFYSVCLGLGPRLLLLLLTCVMPCDDGLLDGQPGRRSLVVAGCEIGSLNEIGRVMM